MGAVEISSLRLRLLLDLTSPVYDLTLERMKQTGHCGLDLYSAGVYNLISLVWPLCDAEKSPRSTLALAFSRLLNRFEIKIVCVFSDKSRVCIALVFSQSICPTGISSFCLVLIINIVPHDLGLC